MERSELGKEAVWEVGGDGKSDERKRERWSILLVEIYI